MPRLHASLALACFATACAGSEPVRYSVVSLKDFYPYINIVDACGLNDKGEVAGDFPINGTFHGFHFDGKTVRDIGSPGSIAATPYGINNRSEIVGVAGTSDGKSHAFLFRNGDLSDISAQLNYSPVVATAINDRGEITVRLSPPGDGMRGFLYRDGLFRDIGTLGGSTYPTAINIDGVVVGNSQPDSFTPFHPFFAQDESITDLGTFGGKQGLANGLNASRQIVGKAQYSDNLTTHAFVHFNGRLHDLGTLGTGRDSEALAINDAGVIVGTSTTISDIRLKGFIYKDGQMLDLNTLIPPEFGKDGFLSRAIAINNRGQILATISAGVCILTPVPEPAAPPPKLVNFSARVTADPARGPSILGFILKGAHNDVLARAAGPALARFGVANSAVDPSLRLLKGGTAIGENNDWNLPIDNAARVRAGADALGAFPFTEGSRDASLLADLAAGNYSSHTTNTSATPQVTLTECYSTSGGGFSNASARSYVRASDTLTFGFVIAEGPARCLIRAVGPALSGFGVASPMPDPTLEIYRAGAGLIVSPTTTALTTDAQIRAGAFPTPANSKDAATVAQLPPGAYTVSVASASSSAGEVLVEIYLLP